MRLILKADDITFKILENLSERPTSGEVLARKIGISRTAIWKNIMKLKKFGYEITSAKGMGYKLEKCPDLSPYEVLKVCKKLKLMNKLVKEIHYYKVVDSTNTRAKEERKPGLLIVAERQTKGKGRFGRKWYSEKGGLYLTITLPGLFSIDDLPKISLLAGVSVCKALNFLNAKIKWPNDILIENKKVCGILCETIGEYESLLVLVGIGVNVNNELPKELSNATSLKNITGKKMEICKILEKILLNFFRSYEFVLKFGWSDIIKEWKKHTETIGKTVKIVTANMKLIGKALDINENGSLIIKTKSGEIHEVSAGECIHLNHPAGDPFLSEGEKSGKF